MFKTTNLLVLLPLLLFSSLLQAQRVSVSGTEFRVGSDEIWISGTNTPWDNWNDFGGDFDEDFWEDEFQRLENEKVNATRVWLACNSFAPGININSDGYISGVTNAFWQDLDFVVALAEQHKVYLMVAPLSHFQFDLESVNEDTGELNNDDKYVKMIKNSSNRNSFINNYLAPMVQRYKNKDYFMAIDVINEGEFLYDNPSLTKYGDPSRSQVLSLIAKSAKYVHENSDILVTLGTGAGPKYQSDPVPNFSYFTNDFADNVLKTFAGNDSDAVVDFYNLHWYSWMDNENWPSVFDEGPSYYGLTDKPTIIGECRAKGNSGKSILNNYQHAYNEGYAGIMPWTSNGPDKNPEQFGTLNDHKVGSNWFYDNYPDLVYPGGSTGGGDNGSGSKLEAEDAQYGSGVQIQSNGNNHSGSGYANFPSNNGYVQFNNISSSGGNQTLTYRYALGSGNRTGKLIVNGNPQNLTMNGTGSWTTYQSTTVTINLNNSSNNTIRFESSGSDFGNLDYIEISGSSGGDDNNCSVSLSSSSKSFSSSSGNQTVTVTTSESYSVSDNRNWISVSKSGSTVTINVDPNSGSSSRSGTVTVSGCENKTISVTQNGSGGGGNTGGKLEAEDAQYGSGSQKQSGNGGGYSGSGYINFPSNSGFVQYNNVSSSGGSQTLTYRYALGSGSRTGKLIVNGSSQNLTMSGTGGWGTYQSATVNITLNNNSNNTIRFESSGSDFGNLDYIEISGSSGGGNTGGGDNGGDSNGNCPGTLSGSNRVEICSPSANANIAGGSKIDLKVKATSDIVKVEAWFVTPTSNWVWLGNDSNAPYEIKDKTVPSNATHIKVRGKKSNNSNTPEVLIPINVSVNNVETRSEEEVIPLAIYPNPTNVDYITVETNVEEDMQIELFNVQGSRVKVIAAPSGQGDQRIFIGELSSGMYLVRMGTVTQKLIIQ